MNAFLQAVLEQLPSNTTGSILWFGVLPGALAWFIYSYVQRRHEHQADSVFAEQHGCQPILAVFPTKWPYGLDVLKAQFAAIREHRLFAFQGPYIEQLGPNFVMDMLGSWGIASTDPKNVEAILSTRFEDFGMGTRRDALFPFVGEGIFTQDGVPWKHSREMLRRPFSKTRYQDLRGFGEHADKLIATLASSSGVVDLQPLFFKFTLATTTALIFGQSVDSLGDEEQDSFSDSFDYASLISSLRIRLQDVYWAYAPSKYKNACRSVKEFADGFVRRALREKDKDMTEAESEGYAFIRDLYEEMRDRALVRDQLVNVLLAGRDTTACLLSWTFFLLVRHQPALDRLRTEVHAVVGNDSEITRSHIQRMSYLKCILNETLRLYPSVPINLRIAQRTTWLPSGGGPDGTAPILVPRGIGVGFIPYYLHRRKDLYGEDAFDFRPERWEGPELANIGYGYIPFHGGPRICLGKDFALLEASYAIVRILRAFPNLRLPPGLPVVPTGQEKQALSIFLSSADGCKVLLK